MVASLSTNSDKLRANKANFVRIDFAKMSSSSVEVWCVRRCAYAMPWNQLSPWHHIPVTAAVTSFIGTTNRRRSSRPRAMDLHGVLLQTAEQIMSVVSRPLARRASQTRCTSTPFASVALLLTTKLQRHQAVFSGISTRCYKCALFLEAIGIGFLIFYLAEEVYAM